jgi:hypothetical protein
MADHWAGKVKFDNESLGAIEPVRDGVVLLGVRSCVISGLKI